MEELLEECYIKNEYFYKMLDLFKEEQNGTLEKHHIIPRSYFKHKGIKVVDENNLVSLTKENHILAHYYIYRCCKDFLKESMGYALKFMTSKNGFSSPEIQYRKRKVVCLDTAKVYNSIAEAKQETKANVLRCCQHKQISSKGLHFEYAEKDSYTLEETLPLIRKQSTAPYTREPKKIICLETGEIFESIRDACKKLNADRKNLQLVLKGFLKTYKKKHFEIFDPKIDYNEAYLAKYNKGKQFICLETGEVFSSVKEANKYFNSTHISDVLLGKRNETSGKHFEIFDPNKTYNKENNLKSISQIKKRSYKILCVETGETFESLRQASELKHTNRETIKKSISQKTKAGKYTWQYI